MDNTGWIDIDKPQVFWGDQDESDSVDVGMTAKSWSKNGPATIASFTSGPPTRADCLEALKDNPVTTAPMRLDQGMCVQSVEGVIAYLHVSSVSVNKDDDHDVVLTAVAWK